MTLAEPARRARIVRDPSPTKPKRRKRPPGALLLSRAQAAELLGIGKTTFAKWEKLGLLPLPMKRGRVVRWSRFELEEWVRCGMPNVEQWQSIKQTARTAS